MCARAGAGQASPAGTRGPSSAEAVVRRSALNGANYGMQQRLLSVECPSVRRYSSFNSVCRRLARAGRRAGATSERRPLHPLQRQIPLQNADGPVRQKRLRSVNHTHTLLTSVVLTSSSRTEQPVSCHAQHHDLLDSMFSHIQTAVSPTTTVSSLYLHGVIILSRVHEAGSRSLSLSSSLTTSSQFKHETVIDHVSVNCHCDRCNSTFHRHAHFHCDLYVVDEEIRHGILFVIVEQLYCQFYVNLL